MTEYEELIKEFHELMDNCEIADEAERFIKPYISEIKYSECVNKGIQDCNHLKFDAMEDIKEFLIDIYKQSTDSLETLTISRYQNHDVVELLDNISDNLGLETEKDMYIPRTIDEGNWTVFVNKDEILKHHNLDNELDDNDANNSDDDEYFTHIMSRTAEKRLEQFKEHIKTVNDINTLRKVFDSTVNAIHTGGKVVLDYLWKEDWLQRISDDLGIDSDDIYSNDEIVYTVDDHLSYLNKLIDYLGKGNIISSNDLIYLNKCLKDVMCDNEFDDFDSCVDSKRQIRPSDIRMFR